MSLQQTNRIFIPPKGLYYHRSALSESDDRQTKESQELMNTMNQVTKWYNSPEIQTSFFPVSNNANSRKVLQFGYGSADSYNYSANQFSSRRTDDACQELDVHQKIEKIPEILVPLKEFAEKYITDCCDCNSNENVNVNLNQCIINRYLPGQGIAPHIDSLSYGPYVACFTFLSGREMEFTNSNTKEKYCLYTDQYTMYIMADDARYRWKHQMRSRKNDKVDSRSKCQLPRKECFSVTFREVF